MRSNVRRWIGMGTTCGLVAASLVSGGTGSAAPDARAAKRKTITVKESADLHLDRKKGGILRESGTASGTLPGRVSARFDTSDITNVTGTVTFKPYSGGTITATVVAYPQSLGTVAKFTGGLSVKSGRGRYAHASGGGTLRGSVNRRTWHIKVKTSDTKLTY